MMAFGVQWFHSGKKTNKIYNQKLNKSYIELVKVLQKSFSDMEAGQRMRTSSPKSIAISLKHLFWK